MNYSDISEKIAIVQGFMGSERQREYMFELGKRCNCAAEIGTWKGLSASIVGLGMLEGNNNGKYYCIDTFESSNTELDDENTWEEFNKVINDLNLNNILIPVVGYSYNPKVWSQIPNGLDFVYIDGDHEPESILQDTVLYVPKVKTGGLIIYHDHTWDQIQTAVKQAIKWKIITLMEEIDDCGIYTTYNK